MKIVESNRMIEDCAKLIMQRLEIGLRIRLVVFVPVGKHLILPCNYIFCGDLADFPLAEIRQQLLLNDILLGLPCTFFQPCLEIFGIDFAEGFKAHVQVSRTLLLEFLFPFLRFTLCRESSLTLWLA